MTDLQKTVALATAGACIVIMVAGNYYIAIAKPGVTPPVATSWIIGLIAWIVHNDILAGTVSGVSTKLKSMFKRPGAADKPISDISDAGFTPHAGTGK